MSAKWVDTKAYSGACRRDGRDRFRLLDRRREDLAGEPPSLGTMLRRLRLESVSLDTIEARLNFLSHLNAAIDAAHAQNALHCARALDNIAHYLRAPDLPAEGLSHDVETQLLRAFSLV